MTNKKEYTVAILDPAPRMTQTTQQIFAESYAEAVAIMQGMWKSIRRSMTLHSDRYASSYYWHRIDSDGKCVDRNTNSGVPALSQI